MAKDITKEDSIRLQIATFVVLITFGYWYVFAKSQIEFIQSIAAIFIVLPFSLIIYLFLIALTYLPVDDITKMRKTFQAVANFFFTMGVVTFFWGIIVYVFLYFLNKSLVKALVEEGTFAVIWLAGTIVISLFLYRQQDRPGIVNDKKELEKKPTKTPAQKVSLLRWILHIANKQANLILAGALVAATIWNTVQIGGLMSEQNKLQAQLVTATIGLTKKDQNISVKFEDSLIEDGKFKVYNNELAGNFTLYNIGTLPVKLLNLKSEFIDVVCPRQNTRDYRYRERAYPDQNIESLWFSPEDKPITYTFSFDNLNREEMDDNCFLTIRVKTQNPEVYAEKSIPLELK